EAGLTAGGAWTILSSGSTDGCPRRPRRPPLPGRRPRGLPGDARRPHAPAAAAAARAPRARGGRAVRHPAAPAIDREPPPEGPVRRGLAGEPGTGDDAPLPHERGAGS